MRGPERPKSSFACVSNTIARRALAPEYSPADGTGVEETLGATVRFPVLSRDRVSAL